MGLVSISAGWVGSYNTVLWDCCGDKVTISCLCALQERAESITTFALCGFANLSSIGIMLGGLSECDPYPGYLGMGQRNLRSGRDLLPSGLSVQSRTSMQVRNEACTR